MEIRVIVTADGLGLLDDTLETKNIQPSLKYTAKERASMIEEDLVDAVQEAIDTAKFEVSYKTSLNRALGELDAGEGES